MQSSNSEPKSISSRLLPEVLSRLEYGSNTKTNVLDLGPGNSQTVDFFAAYNARVSFLDLPDCHDLLTALESPDANEDTATAHIEAELAFLGQYSIDVFLFWDYLQLLNPKLLQQFSIALSRRTLPHSKGYGFGAKFGTRTSSAAGTLDNDGLSNHYGIVSDAQVIAKPQSSSHPLYSHSQQYLNDHFQCLHISKATLQQDGRLELLFENN